MYIPILKGKRGELTAWSKLAQVTKSRTKPLFEIVPNNDGLIDIPGFIGKCAKSLAAGDRIAIDAVRYVPRVDWSKQNHSIYSHLQTELGSIGVLMDPVIGLDSALSQVQDATAARAADGGITLRVTDDVIDTSVTTGESQQKYVNPAERLHDFRLSPDELHLVIDLGGRFGTTVSELYNVSHACLTWALAQGQWRSITLASGCFPRQITHVPTGQAHRIPRTDAAVWNMINQANPTLSMQYGDYGIKDGYPPVSGGGFPHPNIRYTTDSDWIVWREEPLADYPNSSIYRAYAGLTSLSGFRGSGFSWADNEIFTKSTSLPGPNGAGGGEQWLTYGFNHHIELVVDRLTNQGVA